MSNELLLSKLEGLDQRLKRIEDISQEQNKLQRLAVILTKSILTLGETAVYLDMSESHIYKKTAQKKIPHFNPGGKRLFFRRDELDQWLLRNRQGTSEEISKRASNYLIQNTNK